MSDEKKLLIPEGAVVASTTLAGIPISGQGTSDVQMQANIRAAVERLREQGILPPRRKRPPQR